MTRWRSPQYATAGKDLRQLDKRKESILKSLEESGKLTPELEGKVRETETMSVLEDIYLPYRPKRRTRASVAREKGLGLWRSGCFPRRPSMFLPEAARFVSPERVSFPSTTPSPGPGTSSPNR